MLHKTIISNLFRSASLLQRRACSTTGRPVTMSRNTSPAALFHSLTGTWTLNRDLHSANAHEPSGKCFGTATFTPRPASPVIDSDGKLRLAIAEMLYHEQGEFQLPSLVKVPFSKKYVWRLVKEDNQGEEKISVWFTKPGSDAVDYLFHDVQIIYDFNELNHDQLHGSGGHLCVDDFYSTEYDFRISPADGQAVESWSTVHDVRGPKKDQTLTTTFSRS